VRHFGRQLPASRIGMATTMLISIHCLRAIFGRLLLMSAFADVGSAVLVQARYIHSDLTVPSQSTRCLLPYGPQSCLFVTLR
jgi:hypothetical protein